MYFRRPGFDDESDQVGMLFATHAAVAMAGAQRERDVHLAVSARDIIGRTKAILLDVTRSPATRRSA